MTERITDLMIEDHKQILKVADALSRECQAINSGKAINKKFFENAIDFVRNYADKFHHAKEEEILFKEFTKNEECMHCNPVPQMLHEHDLGREYIKNLEQQVQKNNIQGVISNALGYAELIRDHIFKEDNILYPMTNEALDGKTQKIMMEQAIEAETKKFTKGTKERYLTLADELAKWRKER